MIDLVGFVLDRIGIGSIRSLRFDVFGFAVLW
jgi:hypothetical protein